MYNGIARVVLHALAGVGCALGGATLAHGAELAMLGRLEPGLWELRVREGGGIERICVDDGRRLIQLRHAGLPCRQVVAEDSASAVTVHYTCTGQGSGRTHVRLESPRLVQVESSGVAGRLPFDFTAEARRVGSCAPRAG